MRTAHKRLMIGGAVIGALALAGALWGPIESNVEQPKYTVVARDGRFEIRDYPMMIVAQTTVTGTRDAAIRKGFQIIADYIFGNNRGSRTIAMTAPVMQRSAKDSAITDAASDPANGHDWQIRFVMPSGHTLVNMPAPNNAAVGLQEIQARRFAAVRFSGLAGRGSLRQHTEELQNFIKMQKQNAVSAPVYAFYNPPWTLPFLRRNEILIEISS